MKSTYKPFCCSRGNAEDTFQPQSANSPLSAYPQGPQTGGRDFFLSKGIRRTVFLFMQKQCVILYKNSRKQRRRMPANSPKMIGKQQKESLEKQKYETKHILLAQIFELIFV